MIRKNLSRMMPVSYPACNIIRRQSHNGNSLEFLKSLGHPLMMSFDNLSLAMGGAGKAKIIWEHISAGRDPLISEGTDRDLSPKAKARLLELLDGKPLVAADMTEATLSDCGTRKLLLKQQDGQSIETVLIPSTRYRRTTLCVSSQIGCDRACKFCLTGKMGFLRNLSAAEIVSQVILAQRVAVADGMPPMKNIVFMGMGDAGRNVEQVQAAIEVLVDTKRGRMSPNKITVSTVGPSPQVFDAISKLPTGVAWSLHTCDADLRRKLIPSSHRHTPTELRDALMASYVTNRRPQDRILMVAITLIDGVNDSPEQAAALADFITPMLSSIPRIVLDLIPYNDINYEGFVRPSQDKVNQFQRVLRERGFFVSVRLTRGDKESAACGMLATKVIRRSRRKAVDSREGDTAAASVVVPAPSAEGVVASVAA